MGHLPVCRIFAWENSLKQHFFGRRSRGHSTRAFAVAQDDSLKVSCQGKSKGFRATLGIKLKNSVTPLLDIRDLTVTFPTPHGRVAAVREASFSISAGEVLGLVGESGSG
jgi:ABC-type uncharacterized transport system ATPase subunit